MTLRTIGIAAVVYAAASVVTFVAYGFDKWSAGRAARSGRRPFRIAEQTLHFMELMGGWPGALIGQQVFRHKRSKGAYMRVFWVIVVVHVVVWGVITYTSWR